MEQVFRVYYEEIISYEDYVQGANEEEAKSKFVDMLINDVNLKPVTMEVGEFEAEDVKEDNFLHVGMD